MLWGLLVWLVFVLLVLFYFIVVLVVPSAEWRQKLATWTSRMAFVTGQHPSDLGIWSNRSMGAYQYSRGSLGCFGTQGSLRNHRYEA